MGKELIFLCWEEELKKEIERIIEFLCLKPVCFDDVESFYNKVEGLESFVAIIDVFLPRENGYLVCKKTKEKFKDSRVYLSVSRGLSKEELMERWKADGIIYKPLDWMEIEECLLKEEIDFLPPPEDSKVDFEGLVRILSDPLYTLRNCEVQINGEKIRISYGWMEKGDFEKLLLRMDNEEFNFSFSPLKELLSEESIIHLSEVIREIARKRKGPSFIPLEDKLPSLNIIKKEGLWFLTPYETNLIKKIETGNLGFTDEEKKRIEEKLYFLFLAGILSVEKGIKSEVKEEEKVEKEEPEREKPKIEEEKIKELEKEPEKEETLEEEEIPSQKPEELLLSPPEEREVEKEIVEEKRAPVSFSPPEELEVIRQYPEEKHKVMSGYEELKEEETLLEEVLPPVKEIAKEENFEESEEQMEEVEENSETEEEKKHVGEQMEEMEESPETEEETEQVGETPVKKIVFKPVSPPVKKEIKWKKSFLKILPLPFILSGLIFFIIFGRGKGDERDLKKAEKLITVVDKEEFLNGYKEIKGEKIKIALQAIGYEAGWFDSIPQSPKCKENEKFCLLLKNYIDTLSGSPTSSTIEEVPENLLSKFISGRLLLLLNRKKGVSILEGINIPLTWFILLKEACDMVSFEKLNNFIEKFPDEWKKKAIECAWSRKNYDFILNAFNRLIQKDKRIMMLAGISYFEKGDERGIKILEEVGSSDAYYQIGNFMEKKGRKEEAIRYYSMVKDGEYLESAKRKLRSLEEKPKEAKPPSPPPVEKKKPDLKTLIGLAVSERKVGNTGEAIRLLNEALKIEPQNPDANYHLGMIMVEMGDFDTAKTHLNVFLKNADPRDGRIKEVSTLLQTLP